MSAPRVLSALILMLIDANFGCAQLNLTPSAEKIAAKILDGDTSGDKLSCTVSPSRPYLDFSFRFELGYFIACPFRQFGGEKEQLAVMVRVRPPGAPAKILGDVFDVPPLPENLRGKVDITRFKGDLELSGAIGIGEGEYEVELAVADSHNRFFRKHWKTRAELRGAEKKAEVSIPRNGVAPLVVANFSARQAVQPADLNLTILLNATPINPYARKLRAWDRAFLLGSVASLMRQLPSARVRLVAFNTDQISEIFQTDALDNREFKRLNTALMRLELGKVSVETLRNAGGWSDLLNQMVAEKSKADALVFLGPQMRQDARIERDNLSCRADEPPLFYLKYSFFAGAEHPDSIDHLTKDCKGRVLAFHSPGEFGDALQKMRHAIDGN